MMVRFSAVIVRVCSFLCLGWACNWSGLGCRDVKGMGRSGESSVCENMVWMNISVVNQPIVSSICRFICAIHKFEHDRVIYKEKRFSLLTAV